MPNFPRIRLRRRSVVHPGLLAVGLSLLWPFGDAAWATDSRIPAPWQEKPVTRPIPDSDSLRLHLELPEEVGEGVALPMTLRVENVLERHLDLYLTGRPIAFDLVVTDEEGGVVWRRLEGQVVPMVLRIETLAPGGVLELTGRWDQRSNAGDPVPPGVYTVRGEVLAEDGPLVTPARRVRIVS